jgi:predicted transcriptional regulator
MTEIRRPLTLASAKATVSIGPDLRQRLDAVARQDGRDATSAARLLIRQYVEAHEQRGTFDAAR